MTASQPALRLAAHGLLACLAISCAAPREVAPSELPTEIHRGDGWVLRIPEGAKVRQEDDRLAVDAPDGRRWFDVSWHDADLSPEAIARAWAAPTCKPAMWDEPSAPVEGTWTGAAACTIEGRRFYALFAVETFGDRRLLTAYAARDGFVPYENAWVDFVRTALTLRAGNEPLPPPDLDALRDHIRKAAAQPAGNLPVPGGGRLSGRISRELPELWRARRRAPPTTLHGTADAEAGAPEEG